MDSKGALALDSFEKFKSASSVGTILEYFYSFCQILGLEPSNYPKFVGTIQETLRSTYVGDLFSKYETRAKGTSYKNGTICSHISVLVIGAGPCGLRFAIEAQLLGAKVVVLEKRNEFTRNNVLHLWPFVISDLRSLGAKIFCPKFCPGSIDHVSISQLQLILLKICLCIGVDVYFGTNFNHLIEPYDDIQHWQISTSAHLTHSIHSTKYDIVIGADGRQNVLPGFCRKELRAKLAIAITANFTNRRTAAEARVDEISGVSSIFRQSFFQNLCDDTGIDLENIVYYKDETHYFVMTAKKHSLLWKGVLRENHQDTDDLLNPQNVDMDALRDYVLETVRYVTNEKLQLLEFATNSKGCPDLAIFDFTKMYAAQNSCRVLECRGQRLLLGLVGDSLLEPFWPTGSGCARGFLSSLDAAWMIRSWALGGDPLEVVAERETIYRLLAQTTHDNLNKDHKNYTVDPTSRYPNLVVGTIKPHQVKYLVTTNGLPNPASEPDKRVSESRDTDCKRTDRDINGKNEPSPQQKSPRLARDKDWKCPKNENVVESQQANGVDIDFLVEWFQSIVKGRGIHVSGLHDIFVSGDVICATIHSFRPDLIPEYPFPSDIEDGVDVSDLPAFRNQIAFDFMKEEYNLPQVVSGYDSVQYTMTHLEDLILYLFQVYNIFSTANSATLKQDVAPYSESSRALDRSPTIDEQERITDQENVGHKQMFQSYCQVAQLSRENRIAKQKDAENCKLRAMELMLVAQNRRHEHEKQAAKDRKNQIIKTIRAVHVTHPINEADEKSTASASTKDKDDFFNEYNLRLWRKSMPTMEERKGKLETSFAPKANTEQDKKEPRRTKSMAAIPGTGKVNTSAWVLDVLAQKFSEDKNKIKKHMTAFEKEKSDEEAAAQYEITKQDLFAETIEASQTSASALLDIECRENNLEDDGVIYDKVPERAYFSPINITKKCISPRRSPLPFDEKDEELLEMLDSAELEQLEAWTGKYL